MERGHTFYDHRNIQLTPRNCFVWQRIHINICTTINSYYSYYFFFLMRVWMLFLFYCSALLDFFVFNDANISLAALFSVSLFFFSLE